MEATITKQTQTQNLPTFTPELDVHESETEIKVYLEMPGVNETSVEVKVEGDTVHVRGEYSQKRIENSTSVYTEYRTGSYERKFKFQKNAQLEEAKANLRDGVLELKFPITKPNVRKIEIH